MTFARSFAKSKRWKRPSVDGSRAEGHERQANPGKPYGGNLEANPKLFRVALKLATGSGKTTVMAMLIAWQTVNACRRPESKNFTRGFLVVTPGLTIKDRLRVLQPNDPDSYYGNREIVPADMIGEIDRAKIIITNFHAFKLRERIDVSKGTRTAIEGCAARSFKPWKPKARCSSASCPNSWA